MADVEEQVVEEIVEDEVPEPTPVPFQSLMIAYAALSGDYFLYTSRFMFFADSYGAYPNMVWIDQSS